MSTRRIAVGSKRGPKLEAVHEALLQCAHLLDPNAQFEVQGFEVASGVGHTPISSAESMRGARQRVDALMQSAEISNESYQFYVGLEGGLEVCNASHPTSGQERHANSRRVFLESWAYVSDGSRGCFGRSGAIELPEALAHEVLDKGVELAVAVDKFAGLAGVRDAQGAWGVLSRDLITRRDAFRIALLAAFAPFYNAHLYRAAKAAG